MIPDFNDAGYLPTGVHPATLDEIEARFGEASEIRQVQMESVRWMVELAQKAGIQRIVLNGSFVTDIIDPNDVDCVPLVSDDFPCDEDAAENLDKGLPFLTIEALDPIGFERFVTAFFTTDRLGNVKGMVEVAL